MMKSAVLSAALSLLGIAPVAGHSGSNTSKVAAPSTFRPPQVFKNDNLVHIISLEKNYVKENVNVKIENIDKVAHDEYFVPFTSEQMSKIGGIEVKDRTDTTLAPFSVEAAESDTASDIQYYRIRLPTALKPGGQQTLGISYHFLQAYKPLPAAIKQDETQFLTHVFSAYWLSAYPSTKQKTEVKFPSANIPDFSRIPGSGEVKEFPKVKGSKLTYGPFDGKPAGATEPVTVRFEFNKPVLHSSSLERDIEVSHWGGNVAFEERYELFHRGANLSSPFNRVKWAQQLYYQPSSYALKELRFPLRVGSVDAYFVDVIGNVSTSRFRSNRREALLEAKPRYPLFGGWKYHFTIGWNSDTKNFVRRSASGSFVLNVPFIEGPKQAEGIAYERAQIRVILPEGAENVRYHTTIPSSSIATARVEIVKTYLDTIGRTALVIKARNLVDELRERELIVSYDLPLAGRLRKPLVIFSAALAMFVGTWALGTLDFNFVQKV